MSTKGPNTHNFDECEACQLNLILYGESVVNTATGEHYDLPTMLRIRSKPLQPMVDAFIARHGLKEETNAG